MMKCPSLGDHKSGPISPVVTPLSLPRSSASVPFFQTTTAFLLQLNVQNHTINNTQNTLYLSCTLVSTLLKLHLYSCKFTFNSVDQNFLQKQCHLPLTLYECEQKLPAKKINNKCTSCFCLPLSELKPCNLSGSPLQAKTFCFLFLAGSDSS